MVAAPAIGAPFIVADRLPSFSRVVKINELHTVTNDVVEAARSALVIGVSQPKRHLARTESRHLDPRVTKYFRRARPQVLC